MERSICLPTKAEDSSSSIEVFPLLSPVMESELLKEPWPKLETNTQSETTPFWEENFQDLSDWCAVDPQTISRFHIPPPIHEQRDYHIGEDITSKNSGVKDNNDNLSNNKSGLKEITGIDEKWTIDKNSGSIGMSYDRSLPVGQDQFNTITDLSDVWLDPLQTTSGIDEQQTIDSMKLILNKTETVPDPGLDLIGETINNWFPIVTTDNDISCNNTLATNIQDDIILDDGPSTSTLSLADDKLDKKHLIGDFLPADAECESFDLVSYVFNDGNIPESKNIEETVNSAQTSNTIESSYKAENSNTSKRRKERRVSQVRAKVEPYVPPLKINIKNKTLSTNKRRASKQLDQESINYTDSESDAHTSSDYNYRELREKNNKASRKSRINKKVKESEMMKRASDLERDNAVLKMKVEELEKLVIAMRTALLQSALKKEK